MWENGSVWRRAMMRVRRAHVCSGRAGPLTERLSKGTREGLRKEVLLWLVLGMDWARLGRIMWWDVMGGSGRSTAISGYLESEEDDEEGDGVHEGSFIGHGDGESCCVGGGGDLGRDGRDRGWKRTRMGIEGVE